MTRFAILALVFLLLPIQHQAQEFPPLPTPMPWESPTPAPTLEVSIDDAQELLATTEAEQYDLETDGDQVTFNGQEILPDLESSDSLQLFAYMKWIVSDGTDAVLGPFASLMTSLGVLILLGFISLIVYFWENVIVSILKLAGFIINSILRLFGR